MQEIITGMFTSRNDDGSTASPPHPAYLYVSLDTVCSTGLLTAVKFIK